MRVCTYTWPFTFGVRLGWLSAGLANPDPAKVDARVYLLRGNAIVFSRGLGWLCGQLRQRGIWAEDLRCVGDRWACRHLIQNQKTDPIQRPVVFAGHSCGGRYSLYAAHQLHRLGIAVNLIVCFDVALPPDVPPNVKKAVNYYLSRRRIYPARPLRAVDPAATEVFNVDLSQPRWSLRGMWQNHLTVTNGINVQQAALGHIIEAVKPDHRPSDNRGTSDDDLLRCLSSSRFAVEPEQARS